MPFSLISVLIPFCRLMIRLPPLSVRPSLLVLHPVHTLIHRMPPSVASSAFSTNRQFQYSLQVIHLVAGKGLHSRISIHFDQLERLSAAMFSIDLFAPGARTPAPTHRPPTHTLGFFLLPPFLILSICIHRHIQSSASSL